jgi:hypothetical protein
MTDDKGSPWMVAAAESGLPHRIIENFLETQGRRRRWPKFPRQPSRALTECSLLWQVHPFLQQTPGIMSMYAYIPFHTFTGMIAILANLHRVLSSLPFVPMQPNKWLSRMMPKPIRHLMSFWRAY